MNHQLAVTDPLTLDQGDRVSAIAERTSFGVEGAINVDSLPQVVEFAKLMCQAQQGVPKPFRNQPGLCLAVAMQALRWRMDPFGVCQNAYVVNDKVAYEAKVIKAAIDLNAPLVEPLDFQYSGSGETRSCACIGKFKSHDGKVVSRTYETPTLGKITPKNSPLWKNDPDQQLAYFAARAWGRRFTPGVMLGVVSKDEMADQGSVINHRSNSSEGMHRRFLKAEPTTDTLAPDQSSHAPCSSTLTMFTEQLSEIADLGELGEAFNDLQHSEDWAQATAAEQDTVRAAHETRARTLLANEVATADFANGEIDAIENETTEHGAAT
ncbi:recombinase RecT [Maricaulis sp. MIT060901]|uniref:recombinase RecT n=1 Tax=Maricaulis sp. MIT060901 TaxID=3096993 RepID=UPI0039995CE2